MKALTPANPRLRADRRGPGQPGARSGKSRWARRRIQRTERPRRDDEADSGCRNTTPHEHSMCRQELFATKKYGAMQFQEKGCLELIQNRNKVVMKVVIN